MPEGKGKGSGAPLLGFTQDTPFARAHMFALALRILGSPWRGAVTKRGEGIAGEGRTTPAILCQELSRHKNQSADWYLFHGFLDKVFPALVQVDKQSARGALLTPHFNFRRIYDL